ncbi:hypothetical protein BDV26DRAFT_300625 [Aspergillus bertholletiae]|uniref:Zn(2)-C6 fungal-type domain-containing protein n=1 Tax=Aspergillus bertholletiae TaxID=1226010 RepID=A0A5N7AVW3_9EURO|nr:hypothetical protein BDV26DRAFT_300625 [Aspergillus bertholletiae]
MTAQSPLSQRPERPVKLRASCDFCALSKVKCDRGRPHCVRCVKSGIACNYSESRRIGKAWHHYAASTMSSNSSTTHGTRERQQEMAQNPVREKVHPDNRILSTSDDTMSSYDSYQSSNYATPFSMFHDLSSPAPESSLWSQADLASYPRLNETAPPILRSPESADISLPDIPHVAQLRTNEVDHVSHFDLQATPPWDAMIAAHPVDIGDSRDCITRAAAALQTVCDPHMSCMRSKTLPLHHIPSLDATLDDGRTAMETVKDILSCSCVHNIRVALLLVLIIQQVLESYQTLLAQQNDPPRHESPSSSSLSAYDTPMAIGRYLLDNELRSKIIVEVLSAELDKIGSMLNVLARHARGMAGRPDEFILVTYIDSLRTSRGKVLESLQQDKGL